MNYTYSKHLLRIIHFSKEEASRLNAKTVSPEHLMLGMIRDEDNVAVKILRTVYNVDLEAMKQKLENCADLSAQLNQTTVETPIAPEEEALDIPSSTLLRLAILESKVMKSQETEAEHLLLGMLKNKNNTPAMILLQDYDITYQNFALQLSPTKSVQPQGDLDFDDEEKVSGNDRPMTSETQTKEPKLATEKKGTDTPALDMFGYDLTQAARDGKLDPVVGREAVIERVAQVLGRRKKNNPVLIGEPGVGKTAVVEGLAQKIVSGMVAGVLRDKRIVSLDLNSVVAGTKFRGQFEERMKSLLSELVSHPEVILFIDEIHTIVGAGNQSGQMDVANLLKPALSRGTIQCVGATTAKEYKNSIEADGALERRFQRVSVEPTTVGETLQILHNIKARYEEFHHVRYTDEALQMCVALSERYITNRQQPDKAIDVLDEVGARTHLLNMPVPDSIIEKENEVSAVLEKKNLAVKKQNYELAANMRDRARVLQSELETMRQEWMQSVNEQCVHVDADRVAATVSMMTGIPVQRLALAETTRLRNMRAELKDKVCGQDKAVDKIVSALQRSRVGLNDPNRPIGSFLFLGPTGVGKTYLAKELAKDLFGSSDAMIRIDMSEYSEDYSVSRIVGSAPGYIGYQEGGQLTEQVRRKPYSIVLFDEIEKANNRVFNLLLQVLDDGRLTDASGETVNFRNTVIILTSNTGSRDLQDFRQGVGFTSELGMSEQERVKGLLHKALSKQFPPEFLNRIDEIVTFDQLDFETVIDIMDRELQPLVDRLDAQGYKFDMDSPARKLLAQKGYDRKYGARPLRRAIQTCLEDAIAQRIIDGQIQAGDTFRVRCNPNGDDLDIDVLRHEDEESTRVSADGPE